MKEQRLVSRLRGNNSIAFVLTLVLVISLPGCGTSPPGDDRVIDLLDLLPPDDSIEYEDTPAPVLRWDFSSGLPEGWSVGPEGVRVLQRPDGVKLQSPDRSPAWLEIRTAIDPVGYHSLLVSAEPGAGQEPVLLYAFDDPPYYYSKNRVTAEALPDNPEMTLKFELPGPNSVERPVRALRLRMGAGGNGALIRRVVMQPRHTHYIGGQILPQPQVPLGQEHRACWRYFGAGIREITVRLPETGARLSFALGTLRGRSQAGLTVDLLCQGDCQTLLRRPFHFSSAGWREEVVDLSPWSGEEVALRFTVEDDGERTIRLLGTPVIRPVRVDRRPSVLLIMLDAQRADRLSVYGHHGHTSPHLARLAGEGVLFTRAIAPCSWTVPSVVAAFTGRHTDRTRTTAGHHRGRLKGVATLAEHFSGSGYATGGFAANFLLTMRLGFSRGFDTWYVAPHNDRHPTAEQMNRRVLRWLRGHRGEETFCYVHYMDPHAPYDAPWPGSPVGSVQRAGGVEPGRSWRQGNIYSLTVGGKRVGPAGVRLVSRLYECGAEYTDFQVGALLAALRREGLLENTVVLVTADHGEELNDHGYWSHGSTLYQEVIHVPLILRLPEPGPEAGSVVSAPVSLVDVAPTLAAIAGIPGHADWTDGRHLLRLPPGRQIYSQTTAHAPLRFTVVDPPWKYIFFDRQALDENPPETAQGRWIAANGQPGELLFNIDEDPGERRDLLGQHSDVAERMRGLMEDWFNDAGQEAEAPETEADKTADQDQLDRLRALGYVQ